MSAAEIKRQLQAARLEAYKWRDAAIAWQEAAEKAQQETFWAKSDAETLAALLVIEKNRHLLGE